MEITDHLFQSIVYCPYKAHLLLKAESGEKSDYEILQDELKSDYLKQILSNLQNNKRFAETITNPICTSNGLREGHKFIMDTRITDTDLSAHFDAIEKNTRTDHYHDHVRYRPMHINYSIRLCKSSSTISDFT